MKWKVRDSDGIVIAQYQQVTEPQKPDSHSGVWSVENADELNDEPVEWWDERS